MKKREFVGEVDAIIKRLQQPTYNLTPQDIFAIPVEQDYFTAFVSLSPKIGLLGELSSRVVRFYSICKSLIDEIHAFKENRENIMKGLIRIEVIDRQFLLEEIRKMRAFYQTMQDEGMQAIRELYAYRDMSFWQWAYSPFVRKK